MSTIKDIHLPFRDEWQVASFRGAAFFTEVNARESGRRVVVHEFPKKNQDYAEDMGKRATAFTVRGYCITAVRGGPPPHNRDYRSPRNQLIAALEADGPGNLILPTGLAGLSVMCPRYRVSEEDNKGGYCVFDMQFVEAGGQPNAMTNSTGATASVVSGASAVARSTAIGGLNGALPPPSGAQATTGATTTAVQTARLLPFSRQPTKMLASYTKMIGNK